MGVGSGVCGGFAYTVGQVKRLTRTVVAAVAVVVTACSAAPTTVSGQDASLAASDSEMVSETAAKAACEANYLGRLTRRDKLAQLLTVGVTGFDDALAVVRTQHVGGIFIGGWTDHGLLAKARLDQVKSAANVPLLVSIDEEGGRVSRVADLIGPVPSARTIARTMPAEAAYQNALKRGKDLAALGITVNFAPVVDVSDQADGEVIGDRSYSGDPQIATTYADAYVRGMEAAGVRPVLKHFPGHGHGSGDSHRAGVVTTPPFADLQQVDLVPFRKLVDDNLGVMVGHLTVPGLTTDGLPASVSPAVMDLLRKGDGYGARPFNGVIFTDDLLGMAAISDRMDLPTAVVAALEAGADVALWISTAEVTQVLDRLEGEMTSGRFPESQVDASVLRVARFKHATDC